jgi:hypothetical protein
MALMRASRISALVLLASVGFAALTGCAPAAEPTGQATPEASASPSPTGAESEAPASDGQTREEACEIANQAAVDLQDEANEALANQTDPAAVGAALDQVSAGLSTALEDITNSEVSSAVGDLQQRFAAFSELYKSLQSGTPTEEQISSAQTAAVDMQEAVTRVSELCS